MTDEFNNKLDQVKTLLENENMVNSLKTLINMLGNSAQGDQKQVAPQPGSENEPAKESAVSQVAPSNTSLQQSSMDETMDAIIRIKNAYDKISREDDPRINLLMALKPYLSPRRKSKLETAIRVANLTKLSSAISREFEKF
ncbi:MAG: hypothetical protein GX066_02110 [Clostridiaceae bacterium]|nr:hypothetical protein [Clostridiaceae bacterium]